MNRLHKLAELLVCSWALGGDDPELPTSDGILDRALQLAHQGGALPPWFWERVHFAESRVGLQCVELPDILDWAQTAELTEIPNPTYRRTRVKMSRTVAHQLLIDLDIPRAQAVEWGLALRAATKQAIEEYEVAAR